MTNLTLLRVGEAGTPSDSTGRPSQDNNVAGVTAYPPRQGVPTTQQSFFSVVPLLKQVANIAAAQTLAGAGAYALTAGTGATAAVVKGNNVIALDCARCVTLTGVGGTVARSTTIVGYDNNQNLMTQTLVGPAGATTVTTTKAFRYIQSITITGGGTTANVSAGTSDVLGLPLAVPYYDAAEFIWNGSNVTANTNFVAADATSPATAATGDVRGTFNVGAISASDGAKRFSAVIYLTDTTTVTAAWGVPQV